jgi:phosphoribosylformylglycinamidine (FGAM) synthase-like amidotransferase family enzyme
LESSSSPDRIVITTLTTPAEHVLGQDAELIWHKDTSLRGADVVVLPGGFRARRLPADRRDCAVLADHAGGQTIC